jgi:hypothetical protein
VFATLAALLVVAVVVGVFVLRGERTIETPAQDPSFEVPVANAAALAAFLPSVQGLVLQARLDRSGKRLSDAPEHAGVVDAAIRSEVLDSIARVVAVAAPLPTDGAACELRLLAGTRYVRALVHFDGDVVSLGFRDFSLREAVPVATATSLRALWSALAEATVPQRRRLQVEDLRQLVAAIGSDRTIELVGGPFVLAAGDAKGAFPANEHVVFEDEDGLERMTVRGVKNLHVRAVGSPVRVLSRSPSDVLVLNGCEGVVLEGLVLGHVEGLETYCVAPVLRCEQTKDLVLRGCELFGCGTEAVVAKGVERVRMEGCDVHTCRNGVLVFEDARDLAFRATVFRDCSMFTEGFRFDGCERVAFVDCSIRRMDGGVSGDPASVDLFAMRMDEAVRFVGGEIVQNRCRALANSKLLLDVKAAVVRDNGPAVDPAPK